MLHRSSVVLALASLLALAGCTHDQAAVHGGAPRGTASADEVRGDKARPTCEDATDHAVVLALREARTPDERAELEGKTVRGRARLVEMCAGSKDPDATSGCILAASDKERMEECFF